MRFFAVISNKSTLGEYADKISKSPDKFYNKCAVYLLEKVGKYLSGKGVKPEETEVCFEKRNHDYDAMRRYIGKIKDTPMHTEAQYLSMFNPFAITARTKSEEALLKYADLAAHSDYQCANKTRSNHNIPEPRYFEELSERFGADALGNILGHGIKCIHSLDQLELDEDVVSKIEALKAFPLKPLGN